MSLYDIENARYSYTGARPALDGVSMRVEAGERVALLGPNGSGKSTLLRMMDGLIFPSSGSVKFLGRELSEKNLRGEANRFFRSKVGFLFQNAEAQLFSPTVWEDAMFGPEQLGLPRAEAEARASACLELLGATRLRDRMPHELSVGEKKRVAIAGILALDPDVMLLDEPTAGLDPRSCRVLVDIIDEAANKGKTIVTATHDLHLVEELATRVVVFGENNAIVAEGSAHDILNDEDSLRKWNLLHIHRHKHDGHWHDHQHEKL